MWIIIAAPIAFIMALAFVAVAGDSINSLVASLAIGIKYSAYACLIVFFIFILMGLLLLLHNMYKHCETKGEKVFLSFTLTGLFSILVFVVLCKLKTTNITVVNESKDEIITEINIVPIDDESYPKETNIFNYKTFGFKIRFTDEMTERCKKLGLKYKKGEEWFSLKGNEKYLVSGLWNSESYTFKVPKGTWIITLKTINRNTENFYSVIYNKNAFCTHLGEKLSFTYTGEHISITDHQKAQYMPEIVDKHLKKENSKKFEPNIIIITKKSNDHDIISGLIIKNESQFSTFPSFRKGKYEFLCLMPDNTYVTKVFFSEWNGSHYVEVFSEEKEITINKDRVIFYLDEDKKTVKQIDSSINYTKIKIEN